MSRFTKETFPEKWQILITKENFDIITPYYAEVSSCYTQRDAISMWIKSHNTYGEEPKKGAVSSFYYRGLGFIDITTEQFVKYVLNKQSITEDHSQLIKLLNDVL